MRHCHDCNTKKSCVQYRQSELFLCNNCEHLRQVDPPQPGSAPRHLRKSNTSDPKMKEQPQAPPAAVETPQKCKGQTCSIKTGEATCCCFICQENFHLTCVGLSRRPPKTSNWCCKTCINFPTIIRKIYNELNVLSASHGVLQSEVTELRKSQELLIKENDKLNKELESLKQSATDNLAIASDTEHESGLDDDENSTTFSCLIVGDSIVRTFDATPFENTEVKSISGATVSDVYKELNQRNDLSTFSDIVIHAGTNDVTKNIAIDDSVNSMEAIITSIMVKAPTANVYVSAVCPRTKGQVQHKVETLNEAFKDLASRLDCKFVDSSLFMTYRNGSVDDSQLVDGLHLSDRGHDTLVRLFVDSVEGLKPDTWQSVPSRKTPSDTGAQRRSHAQSKRSRDHRTDSHSAHNNRSNGRRGSQNTRRGRGVQHRNYHGTANSDTERSQYSGCFNCGLKNHNKNTCFHENRVRCHKCNKLGHKANYCKN